MNTDSILDGLQKPTWTYGNQDDWDKLTADNARLRELLGEVDQELDALFGGYKREMERLGANLSHSAYIQGIEKLQSRVQQKLEE